MMVINKVRIGTACRDMVAMTTKSVVVSDYTYQLELRIWGIMGDHGNGCMESSVRSKMDTAAFSGAWV
jgi:hypothetical protein